MINNVQGTTGALHIINDEAPRLVPHLASSYYCWLNHEVKREADCVNHPLALHSLSIIKTCTVLSCGQLGDMRAVVGLGYSVQAKLNVVTPCCLLTTIPAVMYARLNIYYHCM